METIMVDTAFPTLYRKTAGGGLQYWHVKVLPQEDGAGMILTEHGQLGTDSPQTAQEIVREGKNAGKKNATNALEQALKDAKSKWDLQKKKKGYVETKEAAMAGEVDAVVQGGIFPMLAQKFEKQAEKVKYPAFVQPKFDGHRCIAIVENGVCTLWSRTRKPITSCPHICKAVEELTGGADVILDGELYNHDYHDNFEQITKLIRPIEPVEGHEKVKLYVYDIPSYEHPYEDRWRFLNRIFDMASDCVPELVNVETYVVESEDEVPLAFQRFFSQGYEGAMLRTADAVYDGHPTRRSPGLLKLKKFDDAEFEIVDIRQGTGKFEGLAVFVCRAGNGETFDATMNCSHEQSAEYYQHRENLIGMQLTVQFQGFTTKKKVPRFPRALRLREDV